MAFSMAMDWNEGESNMHKLLNVPGDHNPTSAMLTAQASTMLQRAPLLAIGALDDQSRPWTALWGGAPGFSEPLGGGFVGTRTLVDGKYDPIVQALVGGTPEGEMLQPKDGGKMFSGLAIDLVTRKRVKIAGRMAAGTIRTVDVETFDVVLSDDTPKTQDQIQLVTKIEQSLGNCPKYINQYDLAPALLTPQLTSQGPGLSPEGRALIDRADMFFLSTATTSDMDTNHRGGPPGFVRVISPTSIVYPEYSGNRLYQSLGNLQMNPRIGLTFPDYENGDVLYTTGEAEFLIGADAATIMPGTNLALKINLTETVYIAKGLAFRGTLRLDGSSPYTPLLRRLAHETSGKPPLLTPSTSQSARLIRKTPLTPTIARFTFSVPEGVAYKPGQWAALSFAKELDRGWEHMRNSDPRSLNDDFVRTFTISSTPRSGGGSGRNGGPLEQSKDGEFTLTVRNVGAATRLLFQQPGTNSTLALPLLSTGGDFTIRQPASSGTTVFIAAGVGITPLLAHLGGLDLRPARFKLLWTLRCADLRLVLDTLRSCPELARVTRVYVTGATDADSKGEGEGKPEVQMEALGAQVYTRRLAEGDFQIDGVGGWYLCAGRGFRGQVLEWLKGREVVYEDFDY